MPSAYLRFPAASAALAGLLAGAPARAQEALADPTAPPAAIAGELAAAPAAATRALQLQSVLISGERRVAVIDGERVQVGDRVSGFEVAAIESNLVWLESAAGAIRLPLRRTQVKQPAGLEEFSE